MATKYDVIIVGAGPAGLMAAKTAGENGLKVALIERKEIITDINRACSMMVVTLTGKYLDGQRPPGARLTLFDRFVRYITPEAAAPTAAYIELARSHGLDPAQMALAYVNSRPFLSANIIGATTMEQLAANIASIDLDLSPEVLEGIEAIHRRQPNPCP